MWIFKSGANLLLHVEGRDGSNSTYQIAAGYTAAAGDQWILEIDTDNTLVRAHLDDGGLISSTAWQTFAEGTPSPEPRWMQVAGCNDTDGGTVPDSDTCTLGNAMETGISSGILSALSVGAKNFLGAIL